MQEALHHVIEVFYFVPLVCHKSAVAVFPEAYRGGDYRVIRVGLTVSPNMKSKTVGVETLLDTVTNIHDRFATQGNPIVFSQMNQYLCP